MINAIERLLSMLILLGVIIVGGAVLSLPVGCPVCIESVLLQKPIGQVGEIKVFAGRNDRYRSEATEVLGHLPEAVRRVEALLGGEGLRADVIVAPRSHMGDDVEFAGAMQGSLLGPPIIMLPLDSISVDVTAHELVHAVLQNRLGQFRSDTQLPQWFNEGLAMQVDLSGGFSVEMLCALADRNGWPNAAELRFAESFYDAPSREALVLRYAWSKGAVWHMMAQPGFFGRLDRFFDGEQWSAVFDGSQTDSATSSLKTEC